MKIRIEQIRPDVWKISPALVKNGQQFRRQETFEGTERQATKRFFALWSELEEEAIKAVRLESGSLKFFGEAIDYYTDHNPVNRGSQCYVRRMKEEFGNVPIDELTTPFKNFLTCLEKGSKTDPPKANSTLNSYITYAKAALNYCIKNERLSVNPLHSIDKKGIIPRDAYLTTDEKDRLLTTIKSDAPHLFAIVSYSLQVPCRKGELVSARRSSFDETAKAIRFRNGTTKNDEGCWKPIPPNMIEYFMNIPKDCPYLFFREEFDKNGKRTYHSLGDFKRAWYTCLRKAGIEDFTFHDTRHVSATDLIIAGNNERQVMEVANWKTPMLSTYYHRNGLQTAQNTVFAQPKPESGIKELSVCG